MSDWDWERVFCASRTLVVRFRALRNGLGLIDLGGLAAGGSWCASRGVIGCCCTGRSGSADVACCWGGWRPRV